MDLVVVGYASHLIESIMVEGKMSHVEVLEYYFEFSIMMNDFSAKSNGLGIDSCHMEIMGP